MAKGEMALEEASDDALLVLYGNGDPKAARVLIARLGPLVLRVANRLLGDSAEAEDVTQEAMMRLWKIAPDWRQGEAKVSTWLYRVTSNLATDRLRKKRSVGLEQAAEVPDGQPSAQEGLEQGERARALDAAMRGLPERQKLAVHLRHIEGLSNPEIADVMSVGVEAVESLVSRGKRALTKALSGERERLGYGA